LRFQVSYPTGATHEVELEVSVATLGRDPSCDIVLNDPKCSRRHAVIEAGPPGLGLVIRDQGSANGVFVNERKVDRGPLREGDIVRLGDVKVTVLGEEMPGTVVMQDADDMMAPVNRTATLPPLDDLVETRDEDEDAPGGGVAAAARAARESMPPAAAPAPPRAPRPPAPPTPAASAPVPARPKAAPAPAAPRTRTHPPVAAPSLPPRPASGPAAAPARARVPRPLTVSVLAALWVLSIPLYAAGGIALVASMKGAWAVGAAVSFALLAILGGVLAFGLWTAQPWARPLQIAVAGLGILNCPFAIAAIVVLVYMLRAPARRYFSGEPPPEGATESEAAFAAGVVAAVVLGVLLTGALTLVARTVRADLL
jgi:hypothetical protein